MHALSFVHATAFCLFIVRNTNVMLNEVTGNAACEKLAQVFTTEKKRVEGIKNRVTAKAGK